jgi:hypothetical protein
MGKLVIEKDKERVWFWEEERMQKMGLTNISNQTPIN